MNARQNGTKCVKINGKIVDLPKRTLYIAELGEKLGETEKAYENGDISIVDVITAEYDYLKTLFGNERIVEMFDGDAFEDTDISEISLAVINIQNEYNRPVADAKMKKAFDEINRPEVKTALEIYRTTGNPAK